jgi:Family of unknown function (DUF6529)
MEDLIHDLARGNVEEVKVVLASVVAALAVYQVVLMAVGWGKVKVSFLQARPASFAHRSIGDVIVVVTLVIAFMCVGYFGFDDDGAFHAITGALLIGVLALKIAIIRWWHRYSRFLPVLGLSVFALFLVTWFSSAGSALAGD